MSRTVLKPVLVIIHGGAFYAGDSTDTVYGPQYLIQQDLVVVTMNYRLGPLGKYLCSGEKRLLRLEKRSWPDMLPKILGVKMSFSKDEFQQLSAARLLQI